MSDIQLRAEFLDEQVDTVDFTWLASRDKASWLVKPVVLILISTLRLSHLIRRIHISETKVQVRAALSLLSKITYLFYIRPTS